jgi:hypothetical protein
MCKVFSIRQLIWQVTILVIKKHWHVANLHKVQVIYHHNLKFIIHIFHLWGGVVIIHKVLYIATIYFMALYHMFLKIFETLQSRRTKLKWFAFVAIITQYPPPMKNSNLGFPPTSLGHAKECHLVSLNPLKLQKLKPSCETCCNT